MKKEFTLQSLAEAFAEHRARLLSLVQKRLNPILQKRLSHEDVMQEVYLAAAKRIAYFEQEQDVPIYFKLRTILFQTITAAERRHLQSRKRDAYRELEVVDGGDTETCAQASWNQFADTMTGPVTQVARADRYALLKNALDSLSENDRCILEMRHFDGLGNAECAQLLGIEPKSASIRYVRALQRLREKLTEYTEFKA